MADGKSRQILFASHPHGELRAACPKGIDSISNMRAARFGTRSCRSLMILRTYPSAAPPPL